MAYILVESFSGGVDRSRPRYVGPPGTLWSGINGHLTRGGDFEKRKAFVEFASLPVGATHGLAKTAAGLYVFGSLPAPAMPAGVTYQQLQHPFDADKEMTKILSWDLYNGRIYAIAQFEDGSVHHYFDGVHVMDWSAGVVVGDMTDNAGIAAHLADLLDGADGVNVSVAGNVITIEAQVAGEGFDLETETENVEGGTDDQTATVAETAANVAGVAEVLSKVSFSITAGTSNPGTNQVTSITIAGVEVLNTAVDWATSNDVTAANVATQINNFNSTPEYTASASGETVTISAAAGTGAGPNGFSVVITTAGDVRVDGAGGTTVNKNMAGGVDAVAGQQQKATITIGGTFEPGDKFNVTLNGVDYGFKGRPPELNLTGTLARTHRRKMYVGAGSILEFSAVDNATLFDIQQPGAGFQNMSTHHSGSDRISGMTTYNELLAVLARRVIQIWNMQDDDALNQLFQIIPETGTRAPRSVIGFGDVDAFYLSDSGVRSIRARSGTNLAGINDVGTPIDPLIREYQVTLDDETVEAAVSVIEPVDGRFWLALGERIFVFSYFPTKKISAWSWYEPGLKFTDLVTLNDRVYARAGDKIYLYGGTNNDEYGDDYDVTAALPFISGGKPGTFKTLNGIDLSSTGEWNCKVLVNPNDENEYIDVGDLQGVTWFEDGIGMPGHCTHIAPVLVHRGAGYASLSQVGLHTDGAEESFN